MSLDDYRRRVSRLARERAGEPVYNGSEDHASVIVEQMFRSAERSVRILTGNLEARVYGRAEVAQEAELFLAHASHTLQVLLEDMDIISTKDHPLLARIWDNANVEFRKVPESWKEKYAYHFLVMDSDSYRFEKDRTSCEAIAVFGDAKTTQHLNEIFDMLWTVGEPVNLAYAPREQQMRAVLAG